MNKPSEFGSVLILAGGKSQRMGYDKQLLAIHGQRIVSQLIANLQSEFSDFIVVSPNPEYYADLGCRVISDQFTDCGPIGGIHAGLQYAKSRFVYVLACDMPCVSLPYIRFLKQRLLQSRTHIAAVVLNGYIEPFHAFYDRSLVAEMAQIIQAGKRSIKYVMTRDNTLLCEEAELAAYCDPAAMFVNLNTPGDVARFIRFQSAQRPSNTAARIKALLSSPSLLRHQNAFGS